MVVVLLENKVFRRLLFGGHDPFAINDALATAGDLLVVLEFLQLLH
jgi:hypothetical protein